MPKPSFKALLADLEADDLREVVAELCKLSPQNKTFVELFLRGSDGVDTEAILEGVGAKLRGCFLRGSRAKAKPNLAEARRIVTEHERIAADYPAVAAEAALLYVEAAADYADALRADFRFVQQATVDAAVRMLERFVRAALERPAMVERFGDRVDVASRMDPRMHRIARALHARDASLLDPEPPADDDTYRVEYDRAPRRRSDEHDG